MGLSMAAHTFVFRFLHLAQTLEECRPEAASWISGILSILCFLRWILTFIVLASRPHHERARDDELHDHMQRLKTGPLDDPTPRFFPPPPPWSVGVLELGQGMPLYASSHFPRQT